MLLSSYLEDMLASIEVKGRGKDPSPHKTDLSRS